MLDLFRPLASRDHPLRQAKRTLDQIKGAGVLPVIEQLSAALQDGVAKLDSVAEQARLLAVLDPAAQDVVQQLKQALAETEPGAARIGLLLRQGQQFINAFYYQLSEVVRKGGADREQMALFLRWAGHACFFQRLCSGTADVLNWRQIIGPFCRKNESGSDFRIDLSLLDAEIGLQLGRLALLSMVLPLPLDLRQALLVEQLLGLLAGKVMLSPVFLPEAPFVVSLLSQGRPDRLEGWERADDDMRALFLGFDELDALTGHWRNQLGNAVPLENLLKPLPGQTAVETLALIDAIRPCWLGRARSRSEPREAMQASLWVCCDTLRIRGLLAQPVKKKPVADGLVCEAALFNISSRGVGLLFQADYQHTRVGGLIALYQERRDGWALGIIRRTSAELEGRRFVGVELLTDSAHAASIVDDSQQRQPALLLPVCGEQKQPALLLSGPTLTAGKQYVLVSDKQEKTLRVAEFWLAGNDFALYRYEEIAAPA
jgi:hypothetical protein